MLIAVISDLHANLEATREVLRRIDKRGVDQIVCLGDLTGYGADPNEVVGLIGSRGATAIQGNHDAAASGMEEPWFFHRAARRAVEWQRRRLEPSQRAWLAELPKQQTFNGSCLGVHGSPRSRDEYITDWLDAIGHVDRMDGAQVCFFGHSHRAGLFSEGGVSIPAPQEGVYALPRESRCFINPGAVGQPRDGDPRAAFGFFDSDGLSFEFCRAEYDVDACAGKILDAGLPAELAHRLAEGK